MRKLRWIAAIGLVALAGGATFAEAVPLATAISRGDASKFGEDWPTRSENGNSKVSITGACTGDVPADLDLRTCDLVVDGVLFRVDPHAQCSGELVFDAARRRITAPGVLVDDCACAAGDSSCATTCDADDPSCLQACPGGKPTEVIYRSDQRARPTLKVRMKRREVDHRQRLEFSMTVDRAVTAPSSSCPDAWDPAAGVAFLPDGHSCLETRVHLECGTGAADQRRFACAAGVDWRPSSTSRPGPFTNLRTRGEACVPPPCATNEDCPEDQFCRRVGGACWALGECARQPQICPMFWDPVCGCDGRTYTNSACAASAGASVASSGVCR